MTKTAKEEIVTKKNKSNKKDTTIALQKVKKEIKSKTNKKSTSTKKKSTPKKVTYEGTRRTSRKKIEDIPSVISSSNMLMNVITSNLKVPSISKQKSLQLSKLVLLKKYLHSKSKKIQYLPFLSITICLLNMIIL